MLHFTFSDETMPDDSDSCHRDTHTDARGQTQLLGSRATTLFVTGAASKGLDEQMYGHKDLADSTLSLHVQGVDRKPCSLRHLCA